MAESTVLPNKQRLKKCTMKVKKVYTMANEKANFFSWKIGSFRSLKKNVEYWNKSDYLNWTFSILKKSKVYIATIYTADYDEKIVFCVCYYKDHFSSPITADRISENIQEVNIPDNVIDVSENSYLQAGHVELIFIFNDYRGVIKPTLQERYLEDESTFRCVDSLYNTMENTSFTDFIVYVENDVLPVHKAVLASRNNYFRQYIKENCTDGQIGEMVVDTTYGAMYTVISFIYSGHVVLKYKDDLTKILALSEKFGLLNLQTFIEKRIKSIVKD